MRGKAPMGKVPEEEEEETVDMPGQVKDSKESPPKRAEQGTHSPGEETPPGPYSVGEEWKKQWGGRKLAGPYSPNTEKNLAVPGTPRGDFPAAPFLFAGVSGEGPLKEPRRRHLRAVLLPRKKAPLPFPLLLPGGTLPLIQPSYHEEGVLLRGG